MTDRAISIAFNAMAIAFCALSLVAAVAEGDEKHTVLLWVAGMVAMIYAKQHSPD